MRKISAEEKLLRMLIKSEMKDISVMYKQEIPICRHCFREPDITDEGIKVDFREIEVRGKAVTVAEPYCPGCGQKIRAVVNVDPIQ